MKRWLETLTGLLDKLLEKVAGEKTPQLKPIPISNGRPRSRHSRRTSMHQIFFTGVFVLVALVSLSACTRPGKSQTTTIGLSIPTTSSKTVNGKTIAQSIAPPGAMIGHVAININGPGMPGPQVISWDSHCGGGGSCPQFPNPFSVSVPSGPNRLIQVLVVFMDQNQSMTFAYGDVAANLSGGNKSVAIQIAALGTPGGRMGHIGGRYLGASGVPATGKLIGTFQPPGGKPPMIIAQKEMFGGWFNTFVVEGVGFKYQTEYGETIFNDLAMGSSASNYNLVIDGTSVTNANHIVHMSVPNYWKQSGMMGGWYSEGGLEFFIGWFGAGHNSANQAVCYPPGTPLSIESDSAGNHSGTPLNFDMASPASSSIIGYMGSTGGILTPPGGVLCAPGNANSSHFFVDRLDLDPDIVGSDPYRSSGFEGPFIMYPDSGYGYPTAVLTSVDPNTNIVTVQWNYIPGAFSGSNPIDGVEIWERRSAYMLDMNSMGIDSGGDSQLVCSRDLPSKGFVKVRDAYGLADNSHSSVMSSYEHSSYVLCPFRNSFLGRTNFSSIATGYHVPYTGPIYQFRLSGNPSNDNFSKYIKNESGHNFIAQHLGASAYKWVPMGGMDCVDPNYLVPTNTIEGSIDGGVTWLPIAGTPTTINGQSCLVVNGTQVNAGFSGDIASATASQLMLRYTLDTSTGPYTTAPNNGVVSTGNFTLTNCPTPGVLQLVRDDSTVIAAANFLDDFFVANATDLSHTYKFQYSGCAAAEVPPAASSAPFSSVTGTAPSPSNCFSQSDFDLSADDPWVISIDPKDAAGADCVFSGTNVTLMSIDGGTYSRAGISGTIGHSTAASQLLAMPVYTDISGVGPTTNFFKLDGLMSNNFGSSQSVQLASVKANSDNVPVAVNSSSMATTTLWNGSYRVDFWNSVPGSATANFVGSLSNSAISNAVFSPFTFTNGALSSSFEQLVFPSASIDTIVDMSDSTIGTFGSPLFVADEGGGSFNIFYVSAGLTPESFMGQGVVQVASITGVKAGTNPTISADTSGSYGYSPFVVGWTDTGNVMHIRFYALSPTGGLAFVDAANLPAAPATMIDVKFPNHDPYKFFVVMKDSSANYVTITKPTPTFDGSSWSNVTGNIDTWSPAGNQIMSGATMSTHAQVVQCGQDYYLAGKYSVNFRARRIDYSGNSMNGQWDPTGMGTLNGGSMSGTPDRATCVQTSFGPVMINAFAVYSTTAIGPYAAVYPIAMSAGSDPCGNSPTAGQPYTYQQANFPNVSNPVAGMSSVWANSVPNLLALQIDNTSGTRILSYSLACSASMNITTLTPIDRGGFGSTTLKGLKPLSVPMMGGQSGGGVNASTLSVFGSNGQWYRISH